MNTAEENRLKGNEAEEEFKQWLDKNNIPYLYIQQDAKTFSSSLKKYFGTKRPDFMVLLPNFGFIFVDVKYRKINSKYGSLPLDSSETAKYSSLQRKFNLPIWYVVSNDVIAYQTWYWIPISKVLEEGKNPKFESGKSHQNFFAIPIREFIQISSNDSLDRLFAKCFIEETKK